MTSEERLERIEESLATVATSLAQVSVNVDRVSERLSRAVRLGVREARNERSKRQELDDKLTQLAAAQVVTEEKLQGLIEALKRGGNGNLPASSPLKRATFKIVRYVLRHGHAPVNAILLVESGSRHLLERVLPNLRQNWGDDIFIDLVTCYSGLPEGFRPETTRVYRVSDYRGRALRRQLYRQLRQNRYAFTGIICSGEPLMTKWKWARGVARSGEGVRHQRKRRLLLVRSSTTGTSHANS